MRTVKQIMQYDDWKHIDDYVKFHAAKNGIVQYKNTWEIRGGLNVMVDEMIRKYGFNPDNSVVARRGKSPMWYVRGYPSTYPHSATRSFYFLDEANFAQFRQVFERYDQDIKIKQTPWHVEVPYMEDVVSAMALEKIPMNPLGLIVGRFVDKPHTGYLYGRRYLRKPGGTKAAELPDIPTMITADQALIILRQIIAKRGMPLSGARAAIKDLGFEGKLDNDQFGNPVIFTRPK